MRMHKSFFLLFGAVLLGCIHCSGRKTADQAKTKTLTYEEDVKAVEEAWGKAKTGEEKVQLGIEFLMRNRKRPEVVDIIESIAIDGYLKELKDPKRMMAFAREQTAEINDPKLNRQVDLLFIKLCGEAGDRDGLRKQINDLKPRRDLSLSEYEKISDAAIKAKDWETAQLYSTMLLQRNTAEIIRSETGNQILSEKQVNDEIDHNRCQGLLGSGKALTGKGDYDAAIATYRKASHLATYNYAGYPNFPYKDLNILWTQALLQKGDYKAAIEKISVEAIICEREDVQEILKKAYESAKLGDDLEGFINRTRTRIAKLIPEFQAVGYDGKKVIYRNLKGKVTLVSLWSPFCPPCRVELPRLKPVYEEFHKRGFEIVVVDGENVTKDAFTFIKESGLPYQFLESGSKKGKIEQGLFGFPSYPTSYLIDKNSKLIHANYGYLDGDEKKLRNKIAHMLNN